MKKLNNVPAKLCLVFSFTLISSLITKSFAQVAINTTGAKPDSSAILDLQAGNAGINKGFLPNAVALTATNFANPVLLPATGLIVYNTATAGTSPNNVVPGYYYWNGTKWSGLMGYGTNNYVARWTPNGGVLGTGLIQDNGTSVGINTAPVGADLFAVKSVSGTAVYSNSTHGIGDSAVGSTYGLYAVSLDLEGNYAGIYGRDDNHIGVVGASANQTGVFGSGGYYGVYGNGGHYGGYFIATAGQGVLGYSGSAAGDSSLGATYGVYGLSSSLTFAGIFGENDNSYGVEGFSANQTGVYGRGDNNVGVYGTSANGQGIYGISFNNIGVYGKGDSYYGVYGTSANQTGVYGQGGTYGVSGYSTNSLYAGVYGKDDNNAGVWGVSANFAGVFGSGNTYGIYGTTADPSGGYAGIYGIDNNGIGVYGVSGTKTGVYAQGGITGLIAAGGPTGVSATGTTKGVYGQGGTYGGQFYASKGQGVYASSPNAAGDSAKGATYGVFGYSANYNLAGVFGEDDKHIGVEGVSSLAFGYGVEGRDTNGAGVYGYSQNFYGVWGESWGDGSDAVEGSKNGTGSGATFHGYLAATFHDFRVGYWTGTTEYKIIGNGTVSTIVKNTSDKNVVLHAPETPEVYFEDYGEGQLVNGKVHITLDKDLMKNVVINEKHPLRVFIQLKGDCKGTYVTNQSVAGFDVIELSGGTSDAPFSWHIVCNRADEVLDNGKVSHFADLRFENAPETSPQVKPK